jgi:hypothetical protein
LGRLIGEHLADDGQIGFDIAMVSSWLARNAAAHVSKVLAY